MHNKMQEEENAYDIAYSNAADTERRLKFWSEYADKVHWFKKYHTVLDDSNPPFYRWFPDGELNMSYNCIDRHLADCDNKPALIYESNMTKTSKIYTFNELHD